jgi:hypothetical protein
MLLLDEFFEFVHVAADTSFRPYLLGELLKVRFVNRVAKVLRIIEDHYAAVSHELSEENAGRLGPRAVNCISGWVVAQQQYVHLVEID